MIICGNKGGVIMENNTSYSQVPVKAGFWQSFKSFWLQPIAVDLTPKEKKVFKEVHDFWNQELYLENGLIKLRSPQSYDEASEDQSNDEFKDIKITL